MGIFRRNKPESNDDLQPTPFIAEVLRRIGARYGGFDALAPLMQGGPGMELAIHIVDASDQPAIRTVRVFADHAEVYDAEQLVARFDDLTTADVFGERG